jgi:hypothetical protein
MLNEFSATWLRGFRLYVFASAGLNLVWEVAQLPLYTIWSTAGIGKLSYAVLHCTVGDMMIASLGLFLSILVAGSGKWPKAPFTAVNILTVLLGLGYTIYSEWHNTVVAHAWTYAPSMPTLLGIGLSPVAQWVVVPVTTIWLVERQVRPPD